MMLVPTMREVALSVAVGLREKIGGAVLVGVGVTGMMREGVSLLVDEGVSDVGGGVDFVEDGRTTEPVLNTDVGASLSVALAEPDALRVGAALLGDAVEVADEGEDGGTGGTQGGADPDACGDARAPCPAAAPGLGRALPPGDRSAGGGPATAFDPACGDGDPAGPDP